MGVGNENKNDGGVDCWRGIVRGILGSSYIFLVMSSSSSPYRIGLISTFQDIHQYMCLHGKVLINLGKGLHKIKKKAEQVACEEALRALQTFS